MCGPLKAFVLSRAELSRRAAGHAVPTSRLGSNQHGFSAAVPVQDHNQSIIEFANSSHSRRMSPTRFSVLPLIKL